MRDFSGFRLFGFAVRQLIEVPCSYYEMVMEFRLKD
jgi:hypothetical protein